LTTRIHGRNDCAPALEQEAHRVQLAPPSGYCERPLAIVPTRVHVGAMAHQQPHYTNVSVPCGAVQRGVTRRVGSVHQCATREQHLNDLEEASRTVQSGVSVLVHGVHGSSMMLAEDPHDC
jgi:hypothetical protein